MKTGTVTTTDGVTIAFREAGTRHGPAVMLCHGICASGRQFVDDARAFAELGYRVVIPDLRAHGESGSPSADGGDFSLPRLAGDMLDVLDTTEIERVHWVGNSLGGIVGLEMLGVAPHRFASFATFGTAYRLGLPRASARVLPLLFQVLGPRLLGQVAARITTSDASGRQLIAEAIASFDPGPGERIAESVRAYDLAAAAQQFDGPILLVRCARDRAVNLALPRTFAAMAKHGSFQRVDLDSAGHCANFDVPTELRSLLDTFWRRAGAEPIHSGS